MTLADFFTVLVRTRPILAVLDGLIWLSVGGRYWCVGRRSSSCASENSVASSDPRKTDDRDFKNEEDFLTDFFNSRTELLIMQGL